MTAFRNTDNDGLIRASADWICPGAIVSDDAGLFTISVKNK
jgi:hypothetical protein